MAETSTTIVNTGNQDPLSVFYIHPSDVSVHQLVLVKFSGSGFHNWKCSMILTLSTKNKLRFVDGSIEVPDITSDEYKYWERCNNLFISWIIVNLDDTIAKSVLFLQTTREIWQDLDDRFGYTSMAQVYSLEQQFLDINQGTDIVSEFFTKIKTIWDNLNDANPLPYCTCKKCTCNLSQILVHQQLEHRVLQFMMKLSEQYSQVRGNVLMMEPLPNISQTYKLFAQEESHKEICSVTNQTESMAFYADKIRFNQNAGNKQQTFYSGNKEQQYPTNTSQNFKADSQNQRRGTKPNYFYSHCKTPGHSMERCFKLNGYPPGFQDRQTKKFAAVVQRDNTS
ncbi:uncharacterized protein LOC141682654 [Apium graveolens]|uniref:uncharacterized protein LOC141682654 n=1 Tax=Apium graveolens TaxID=4045 RepID=UPI003D79F39A